MSEIVGLFSKVTDGVLPRTRSRHTFAVALLASTALTTLSISAGAQVLMNGVDSGPRVVTTADEQVGNGVTISTIAFTAGGGIFDAEHNVGETPARNISLAMNAAGTLFLASGVTVRIDGPITGDAANTLTYNGGGSALILSGNNTFAGGITVINGGALVVTKSGALGTGRLTFATDSRAALFLRPASSFSNAITNEGDTHIYVAAGGEATLSGIISGSDAGKLTKNDTGVLVLSGANTYSGGTVIEKGIVQVRNNTALGTGSLTFDGGGVGNEALEVGPGATTIANNIVFHSNGVIDTSANNSGANNVTFSGVFSDAGTLTKIGAGILTVTGDNTAYVAGGFINGGSLRLSDAGALGGNYTVSAAGTLEGGSALSVAAPANNIAGDVTLAEAGARIIAGNTTTGTAANFTIGGTLNAATPGASIGVIAQSPNAIGQIRVGGTANVADSKFTVYERGALRVGQTFTAIQSGGGASGEFAAVTGSTGLYGYTATVNGNNVDLTVVSGSSFAATGPSSSNANNIGGAIDTRVNTGTASSDLITIGGALVGTSGGARRQALNSLSGQNHGLDLITSRAVDQAYINQVYDRLSGAPSSPVSTVSLFGNNNKGSGSGLGQQVASAGNSALAEQSTDCASSCISGPQNGVWIRGFGTFGNIDSTRDAAGANYTVGGVVAGVDRAVTDSVRLGLSAAYSHLDGDVNRHQGDFNSDNYNFGVYGRYQPAAWFVDGAVSGAAHDVNSQRNIRVGAINRQADGDHLDWSFAISTKAGYELRAGAFTLTPALGIQYVGLWQNRFTESGAGAANLRISNRQDDSFQLIPQIKASTTTKIGEYNFTPSMSAGYAHEFIDSTQTFGARLAEGGPSYRASGPRQSRDFGLTSVGLSADAGGGSSLFARYDGGYSSTAETHAVVGGYKFTW